jgi:hypothetical protein
MSTESEAEAEGESAAGEPTADDIDVEVNEEALEEEIERRTVELEIPVDTVHATAIDQLERAGVDVEDYLTQQLRAPGEQAIHDLLQRVKYQR